MVNYVGDLTVIVRRSTDESGLLALLFLGLLVVVVVLAIACLRLVATGILTGYRAFRKNQRTITIVAGLCLVVCPTAYAVHVNSWQIKKGWLEYKRDKLKSTAFQRTPKGFAASRERSALHLQILRLKKENDPAYRKQ